MDRRRAVEESAEPPQDDGGNQVPAVLPSYGGYHHTLRNPANRAHLLGGLLQTSGQVSAGAADMLADQAVTPGATPARDVGGDTAIAAPPRPAVGAMLKAQRQAAELRQRGSRLSQPGPGEDQRALGPKGDGGEDR